MFLIRNFKLFLLHFLFLSTSNGSGTKKSHKSSLFANICVFLKEELIYVSVGQTMLFLTYLMPQWILLEKEPLKIPSRA